MVLSSDEFWFSLTGDSHCTFINRDMLSGFQCPRNRPLRHRSLDGLHRHHVVWMAAHIFIPLKNTLIAVRESVSLGRSREGNCNSQPSPKTIPGIKKVFLTKWDQMPLKLINSFTSSKINHLELADLKAATTYCLLGIAILD
ncbi:hypothetical protein TNCV_2924451 [Trichonephila clavipes]|nr:hypothetical protein TNCV_2924451 [Trichonephila clavipes]